MHFETVHITAFPPRRYAHFRSRLLLLLDDVFQAPPNTTDLLFSRNDRYSLMAPRGISARSSGACLAFATLAYTSTRRPDHLHTSICFRCLIPVHYSYRPCSPVGSEARIAVSISPTRLFLVSGLRPKHVIGVEWASDLLRVTKYRHAFLKGDDGRCMIGTCG